MENPWKDLTVRDKDFVSAGDRGGIGAHGRRLGTLARKNREEYRLRTELPPTPYAGNPSASVVLLNLNPGYADQDLADYAEPAFRRAAIDNLTHSIAEAPFFPIDRRFSATSSYRWWTRRLRRPIEAAGEDAVARNVFCVQAFPYHSAGFDPWLWDPPEKLRDLFPSQGYTAHLLSEAIGRGAMIVGLRSGKAARRYWKTAAPGLRAVSWLRTRTGGAPRSPYVTENSLGTESWSELVRRLQE